MSEVAGENPFDGSMTYGNEIFDAEGNQIFFSAGEHPLDKSSNDVWKDIEELELYEHTVFADVSPMMAQLFDQTEDGTLTEAMAAMADSDDEEEEVDESATDSGDFDNSWAPHGSKPMFMLDLLDSLPRLRLSDDHLKAIIWVMKECGTPNVPSFYGLRKMQARLTRAVGLKPKHHTSALNNQFYMNHPNDLIRLDFANPLVRKFLHVYPEISPTVSEFWQAAKYVEEIEDEELSPMWADWEVSPYRHFYVRELAQRTNQDFVIPVKWVVYKHKVHAEAYAVSQESQYNAHMNMYIANINIPHKLLAQEYFVRFCATSPHASSLEQFDALSSDCKQVNWTTAYDCELNREILFRIRAHLLPADNPQQAESASTSGSSSTSWCREDDSGGSASHRETDEGYHALFSPGKTRKPEETIARIKEQIRTACLGVESAVDALQTETGVKDKIAVHWIKLLIQKAREFQQERVYNRGTRDPRLNDSRIKGEGREEIKQGIITEIQEELFGWLTIKPGTNRDLHPGDHYNVLLSLRCLDPHRDSPCEILHTYLLGEDKYAWHETTKGWNDSQGELFAARLQSASVDGLNMLPLRANYLVQYKNSLIGKHFKGLGQLAIFQLDEKLCSPEVFELWKANGILGSMLWYPEIKNMDEYLADLGVAIDNVLDHWAIVEPTRIMVKYKLHVLSHVPEAVRRFGPSILFATETFECWNAVFRLCSVLSNHQAPSLDIATILADMERFKHQVSGGRWKPEGSDDWTQAGPKIRTFLTGNKHLQRRLGWTPPNINGIDSWEPSTDSSGAHWNNCKYAVARSEDICFPGSWVFFTHARSSNTTIAGRIAKILIPEKNLVETAAIVVIEHFAISDSTDPRLDMPLLTRTAQKFVVKPKDILFKFNAQHDCRHFPERHESKLTCKMAAHSDNSRFHLNMHALHNAHLIRETLPRHLTELKPCFHDRRAKHDEFAAKMRESGPEKRAQAQAKGQATRLRNKQDKADKAADAQERAH
ncbi:hypothetical protein FB451DRAFT_1335854 [Mycena latifolia]|nr:hypothetical protein FB451DRAFT_1335854 [Mycena latifolia]